MNEFAIGTRVVVTDPAKVVYRSKGTIVELKGDSAIVKMDLPAFASRLATEQHHKLDLGMLSPLV